MANLNYLQPKIASWTSTLEYEEPVLVDGVQQTDENGRPVTQTKIKDDPRQEVVTGAQILSIADALVDGELVKRVRIEMRFADGQTKHNDFLNVPLASFNAFDDDTMLLKFLLQQYFNVQ